MRLVSNRGEVISAWGQRHSREIGSEGWKGRTFAGNPHGVFRVILIGVRATSHYASDWA